MADFETPKTYTEMIEGREVEVGLTEASFQLGAPLHPIHDGPIHDGPDGALFKDHRAALALERALPSLALILLVVRRFDEALQAAVVRPGGGEGTDPGLAARVGVPVGLSEWAGRVLEGVPAAGEGARTAFLHEKASAGDLTLLRWAEDYTAALAWTLEALWVRKDNLHPRKLNLAEDYKLRLGSILSNLLLEYTPTPPGPPPPEWVPPQKLLNRLEIGPRMRLEPAPTFYLRQALRYRDLLDALEAKEVALGDLRLTLPGQEDRTLEKALNDQIAFMAGLYLVTASDLGVDPDGVLAEAIDRGQWGAAYQATLEWLEDPTLDPGVDQDPRTFTVLHHDGGSRYTCAAMAGLDAGNLNVAFRRPPSLELKTAGQGLPTPRHIKTNYRVAREIWLPVTTSNPMSPAQWQALCDEHRSLPAIRAAVEGS